MRRTARSSEERRSASAAKAPERTCVACRTVRPKRELVRIVRAPGGTLAVDLRGKAPGRGAYCDPDPACLERGLRDGAIARALEVTIDEATAARLRDEMQSAARVRQEEKR